MSKLEILPWIGIGPVRFGMHPAEVEAVFPEPRKYEDWMDGNLNDSLFFHGLVLQFDDCNAHGPLDRSRLIQIEIRGREDAYLFDVLMANWAMDGLLGRLREGRQDLQFLPNGHVCVRSLGLQLEFQDGLLAGLFMDAPATL